jgi:8-oxo-dGTP pyrophosphatase MutT (NUDIX family)
VDELIRRALAGIRPPADLAAAAVARLPPAVAGRLFTRPLIPAAVLIGLQPGVSGLEVILTRRSAHLRDHAGQISFPGGRLEAADADPIATALREAEEEVGLSPSVVEVLGCLEPQPVVTGFAVCPVVARVPSALTLRPDPFEVAEIFTVPLDWVAGGGGRREGDREVNGLRVRTVTYAFGAYQIWGATAHMLDALVHKLNFARGL